MKTLKLLTLGICFTLGACSNQSTSIVQTNEHGTQWSWDKGTIVVKTPERPAGQTSAIGLTVPKMEAANPLPPEKDKIYDTCDIMPEFPGGQNALLQFLAKNIKYPTEAQQQGKQGKVVVTFVIEKDGSITNAKVTQALYPSLDEESLRIVKSMPKWTPGKMKGGKAVRVQYTVPLTYRLQ